VKFFVLEAVSDVEVSEFLGARLVVEEEARPHDGADVDNFIVLVFSSLDGPESMGLVIRNRLQEVRVEGCSWLVKLVLVGL
jgi:hypothetical protein